MKRNVHAAGVIIEDDNGDILVLRRHKDSHEGESWGLVGGNIDEGEDSLTAALRETSEEINHTIPSDKLEFIKTYNWNRTDLNITFEVFKYKTLKDVVNISLDTNENTDHLWSNPIDLVQKPDLMEGLYVILKDEYKI